MATATIQPFRNEPFADFSIPENRRAMEAALAKVRSEFGREYQLRIGAEWIASGELRHREDIVAGLENAPEAFFGLLTGKNFGKLLVQVGDDPTR